MANILVVVDHPRVAIDLWDMLQNEGHEVRHVTCGQAGLAALERQTPDLIVTDHAMPGLDGHSFADTLQRDGRWSSIPVLTISNSAAAASPLAARLIRKPWSQIALVNNVARLVGATSSEAEFCRAG